MVFLTCGSSHFAVTAAPSAGFRTEQGATTGRPTESAGGDVTSGACLWSGHLFSGCSTVTISQFTGQITHASPEAWRFVGWRWFDPEIGRLRILPAETFGSLPS